MGLMSLLMFKNLVELWLQRRILGDQGLLLLNQLLELFFIQLVDKLLVENRDLLLVGHVFVRRVFKMRNGVQLMMWVELEHLLS